jgi:hypothetical protein
LPFPRLLSGDTPKPVVLIADVLPHAHAVSFHAPGAGGVGEARSAGQRVVRIVPAEVLFLAGFLLRRLAPAVPQRIVARVLLDAGYGVALTLGFAAQPTALPVAR